MGGVGVRSAGIRVRISDKHTTAGLPESGEEMARRDGTEQRDKLKHTASRFSALLFFWDRCCNARLTSHTCFSQSTLNGLKDVDVSRKNTNA